MSSLSAPQSDGYYLPPEYVESGAYRKQSKNQYPAATATSTTSSSSSISSNTSKNIGGERRQQRIGHNQLLKDGVVRFEFPEKAICLGQCQQSIGRGTRFNARKIKTDQQQYFTTKIYEFQLSCRNCQQPWVIRTNPHQERGFDYVSGVKRQSGQEINLVTGSSANPFNQTNNNTADHNRNKTSKSSSLDHLELAAMMSNGKLNVLTEIEELEQIRQLNEVSASVNDADTNAAIRKSFRRERKEKRRRLGEATEKGWRDGMQLLPSNEYDILAANDICYGRPAEDEKQRLSSMRKTSIFSCLSKTRGSDKGSKRRKRPRPTHRRSDDALTRSITKIRVSPVRSCNFSDSLEDARCTATATMPMADEVTSSSSLASDIIGLKAIKKKTIQLRKGKTGLSIVKEKVSKINDDDIKRLPSSNFVDCSSPAPLRVLRVPIKPSSSFLEMMTAYDSDENSEKS